jgi:outer membrane protein
VIRALRFCPSAMIAVLAMTPVLAADLATPVEPPPPPPPSFYVHAGAVGVFSQPNAQPTGGGLFTTANIVIRPIYTLALEAGYFVTPNIAIALSSGVPPIAHIKATGFPMAGILGSNLLGSVRYDSVTLFLQYHFTQFGPIQPYAGIGAGYVFSLGNISDGILTNFSVDQNFALILQAGADLMLTPNWGVFVDGKKVLFSTDAQGFAVPGTVPVRTHVAVDPWLASAGITFKY